MAKEPETFQELLDYLTWCVMTDLVNGRPLRAVVADVAMITLNWKGEQDRKKAAERP